MLDAANEEAAAQVVKQVDAARQEAAAPENREKIGSPIPEEELSLEEQAEAAANSLKLYKTLRHNPLDTVARLREVMRLYRFDNVEIVDRPESFSEAALDAIARHGFSPSMVRGFYDSASDTVYFNAARLSPSEVPGVVFHELVAHKGLREVLAPDAFNSMLDSVSSRHGGEARFREIAERYHLDLETENGRREAAEEYIAHLAEERNEALKPSWWREFLAQVKQLLRRLPYLDRVRWSDREIEALLRRSARAMRRRNRAGSNRDAGMFFAVNENGETLFHITGRDNAMTAQEIIDDPTISINDFVLTSEGSEIWGEITPEMVEKAGEKSGIKALPIKLQKGRHRGSHSGFGLAHLYTEHGKELEGKHYDLSVLLTKIFGKTYQVYVSLDSGNIRLEMVTRNRPREIGVLELQEENGFYSVITAFARDINHYKLRGKEVWRYTGSTPNKISQEGSSVISASKQRTGPLDPLSAENTADTARTTRPKPDNNINDSQEKSSLSDDSSHFSIIGEEGAAAAAEWYGRQDAEMWKMLGLDLSTQQGNAIKRLEDLSVAKRMAEAGKEAETIKLATGWEKGADGKWRTETDDNWQFSPELLRLEPYESLPIDRCIQEGTELFSAYPELREFNVRLSTSVEMQQSKGWFDRDEHEFVLLQDGIPAMKKTLIHEIQHYIQEQEGFAPGGNLYTASRLAATGNYSSTELADAYRKFHDNVKLLPGDLYENIGRVLHEDSFRNFRDVLGEELGELWGSKETAINFMRNAYDSSNRETFLQIYEAELEKAKKGHPDAFSLYRRLAGEVEARNAEKRSGLSLEERLRTLLANTEDVSEQDKIYLEKNVSEVSLSFAVEKLSGDPVASVEKNVIRKHDDISAISAAMQYVSEHFRNPFNTEIGEVIIDPSSIKQSLSHTIYQNKLDAIQALGDVLERGVYLGKASDKDGKPIVNYYFAAPVEIGGERKLVFVRSRKASGTPNRFYVHEVFTEDEIRELGSQQTAPHLSAMAHRNASEFYKKILAEVMNIKSDSEKNLIISAEETPTGPENPDIRFSESGQAEELANLMAKRVAPIIRDASGRDSDVREEVRTLLSQEGFDLSDAELEEIIKRAQQQVRRFRSLQRLTEENDYIRATDPWIATLQDVYSTNFKISTAGKYATEDFSGTWIGKDGGVAPDEAARTLSAAFGQEITDDDVVDHFRYLKRRDILAKRREENRAMEEALREEERLHDMELAEQILAGEFPFDDEFIGSNPRVAKMVRDMVSPAKPGEPRADWATVRAALGQENPQEFAKGYFEGREAGRQEYRERLREARKNTTDIRTLQEIATREVRRVLPEELQGAFLKRIAELGKFRPFMRTGNCGSPPTPGPDRAA